jgi:hypothetical protein
MGNQVGGRRHRRPAVEECHTRPQGLYPHPDIDLKKLRRLILEAKLAPCYPGADDPRADLDECPICFLVSTAAAAETLSSASVVPFCSYPRLEIRF